MPTRTFQNYQISPEEVIFSCGKKQLRQEDWGVVAYLLWSPICLTCSWCTIGLIIIWCLPIPLLCVMLPITLIWLPITLTRLSIALRWLTVALILLSVPLIWLAVSLTWLAVALIRLTIHLSMSLLAVALVWLLTVTLPTLWVPAGWNLNEQRFCVRRGQCQAPYMRIIEMKNILLALMARFPNDNDNPGQREIMTVEGFLPPPPCSDA